jgi:hypothetical protein
VEVSCFLSQVALFFKKRRVTWYSLISHCYFLR